MYKLDNFGGIIRTIDGASIPRDPLNMDYASYLRWESEGNTPLPYDPPVVDPKEQAKADLMATDKAMARIVEDLISILTSKGIINMADLPAPVASKLSDRAALRKVLQSDGN